MMKKIFFITALLLSVVGCKNSTNDSAWDDVICTCPPPIALQPCNTFTEEEAEKLIPQLEKFLLDETGNVFEFSVLPVIQLSDSLKNKAKTRYRADNTIKAYQMPDGYEEVILLTHNDISLPYRGSDDWGVLGLSFRPNVYVCIVSDYRVKDKKNLWKVVAHEFIHSYFSAPHCPNDNPECIMKDAKGKARLAPQKYLCDDCKLVCDPKGYLERKWDSLFH